PPGAESPPFPPLRIDSAYIERLESECDAYNSGLATLRSFLLPGGSRGATLLPVARTVTRRAGRRGRLGERGLGAQSEVGAARAGFDPGEQAGEVRLGQGQTHGAGPAGND